MRIFSISDAETSYLWKEDQILKFHHRPRRPKPNTPQDTISRENERARAKRDKMTTVLVSQSASNEYYNGVIHHRRRSIRVVVNREDVQRERAKTPLAYASSDLTMSESPGSVMDMQDTR